MPCEQANHAFGRDSNSFRDGTVGGRPVTAKRIGLFPQASSLLEQPCFADILQAVSPEQKLKRVLLESADVCQSKIGSFVSNSVCVLRSQVAPSAEGGGAGRAQKGECRSNGWRAASKGSQTFPKVSNGSVFWLQPLCEPARYNAHGSFPVACRQHLFSG